MKIAAIVQAINKSTRLPGKVFKDIEGQPLLQRVIERIKRAKRINQVVIATTRSYEDKSIVEFAKKNGLKYVQGSEEDVLSRFILASEKTNADIIVRITADCPLIDPEIIDKAIEQFFKDKLDYISNIAKRSFPRGLDIEVFSKQALRKVNQLGKEKRHREHVTAFIYENPQMFKIGHLIAEGVLKRPDIRLCVDTEEDITVIRKIYKRFSQNNTVDITKVIDFLDSNPELIEINRKSELEHLKRNRRAGIRQEFIRRHLSK
jgi:spore coat polysaccharide biosynthesis protein SpsF